MGSGQINEQQLQVTLNIPREFRQQISGAHFMFTLCYKDDEVIHTCENVMGPELECLFELTQALHNLNVIR